MRIVLAIVLACISASPSLAFTGAEYLRSSHGFRSGFAWGIVTYQINVQGAVAFERASDIAECFRSGSINSDDFSNAVARYIEANPDQLPLNAASAVIRTLSLTCPYRPQ